MAARKGQNDAIRRAVKLQAEARRRERAALKLAKRRQRPEAGNQPAEGA